MEFHIASDHDKISVISAVICEHCIITHLNFCPAQIITFGGTEIKYDSHTINGKSKRLFNFAGLIHVIKIVNGK